MENNLLYNDSDIKILRHYMNNNYNPSISEKDIYSYFDITKKDIYESNSFKELLSCINYIDISFVFNNYEGLLYYEYKNIDKENRFLENKILNLLIKDVTKQSFSSDLQEIIYNFKNYLSSAEIILMKDFLIQHYIEEVILKFNKKKVYIFIDNLIEKITDNNYIKFGIRYVIYNSFKSLFKKEPLNKYKYGMNYMYMKMSSIGEDLLQYNRSYGLDTDIFNYYDNEAKEIIYMSLNNYLLTELESNESWIEECFKNTFFYKHMPKEIMIGFVDYIKDINIKKRLFNFIIKDED